MKRKATAVWNGTGMEGNGNLSSTSGVLNKTPYSFTTRFKNEDGKEGTNPEELIAAAHAGCFTMALSFQLSNAGFTPGELKTTAIIEMEKKEAGWEMINITLDLEGKVPGIDEKTFLEKAENAKKGCPISKALAAVPITLNAKLS